MFASQESGATRKVFQKPNILRRKPKAKQGTQKCSESPEEKPLVPVRKGENQHTTAKNARVLSTEYLLVSHGASMAVQNTAAFNESQSLVTQDKTSCFLNEAFKNAQTLATTNVCSEASKEVQSLVTEGSLSNEQENHTFFKHELYMSKPTLFGQQVDYNEEEQTSLNIESFLVDSPNKQSAVLSNDSFNLPAKKTETELENIWCLNFMSDDSKDMVTPTFYDEAQVKSSKVNTDVCTDTLSFSNKTNSQEASNVLEQDIIQSCLNSRVIKYKCDMPNCNKSFWNEARLQKHKGIHSRQKTTNSPAIVECPVKKEDSDGVEQRCGKLFPSKDILVKHLNEDHVPEDAAYRCARCGRRFWWATGMRTHAQSTCTRALLCTWPGCGRVFRQPCRLREHARAHTGDRPYPCDYPNCGWAFRSASKLVRHARRHTGERRHECVACGRAFLRREHLRDHAARHHAPSAQDKRPCTHDGCEQTFASMSSLYLHLKKVHQVENNKPVAPKKPRTQKPKTPKPSKKPRTPKPKKEVEATNMLVTTLDGGSLMTYDIGDPTYSLSDAIETANASAMIIPEEETVDGSFTGVNEEANEEAVIGERVEEGVCFGYDLEGRCARTHCTWPLQGTHTQPDQAFTIEEDIQVEQSEGSESNICVRSDLFLHGNVLINEDSEFIIRESMNRAASEAEETSDAGQLDGLDLIDAHPTIDLMQEELMYADAAVDESSFRVFLLNGEELS